MTIDIIKNYSAGCHRKPIFSANPIPLQIFKLPNTSLEVDESYLRVSMDDPFNTGKISVIVKNNNNFKVSSIIVLQGEKLTSSYTYQVLAGVKNVKKILEEESQSV